MTSIEWTDATWNPVVGCSRVSSGCEHCYAERVAHRAMQPAHAGLTVSGPKGPRWTGTVRCLPERLEEPLRWRKPRRVFVNSMSDLFHDGVPDEFIDRVFAVMALARRHTFQVLTKRPMRAKSYLEHADWREVWNPIAPDYWGSGDWPLPNVWLGVSVENQETADERIPVLLQTPAAVRFVSYEPALGPVSFDPMRWFPTDVAFTPPPRLDWIIVGGESGPGARACDVAWIRSAVRQCREAEVPVFVKQLGALPFWSGIPGATLSSACRDFDSLSAAEQEEIRVGAETWHALNRLRSRKGSDMEEWPADLRVREMPPAGKRREGKG